jgi:hypothetical protein
MVEKRKRGGQRREIAGGKGREESEGEEERWIYWKDESVRAWYLVRVAE